MIEDDAPQSDPPMEDDEDSTASSFPSLDDGEGADSADEPLERPEAPSPPDQPRPTPTSGRRNWSDDSSDSGTDDSDADATSAASDAKVPPLDRDISAPRIAAELRRIEAEVRALITERDAKRKRKLAGTRRWHELEEDLTAMRYTGRLDEETLARLRSLVARRHHLFQRLRFLSGTRPTWNS